MADEAAKVGLASGTCSGRLKRLRPARMLFFRLQLQTCVLRSSILISLPCRTKIQRS
jgi:hypothetical protein